MRLLRSLIALMMLVAVVAGCAQLMQASLETLMKQGIELLTAGKYDAAIAKFREVLGRDPRYWNAYLYLARSYIGKGAWSDAIASGRKALELGDRNEVVPVLAEALLRGGLDALGRGQFSEAAGHLVDYVKLKPTDWQGYLGLARAYLGTNSYGDALQALVQGLGRAPDDGARQQLLRGMLDCGAQALRAGTRERRSVCSRSTCGTTRGASPPTSSSARRTGRTEISAARSGRSSACWS